MHSKKVKFNSSDSGFTLVEMLVAVAITGLIGLSIMTLYINSSRTYDVQTQVAEAQQNVRAGIESIDWDLRMAGFDPTFNAGTTITTATKGRLGFTLDITGGESDSIDNDLDTIVDEADESRYADGDSNDANETITFGFSNANDADLNGIVDDLNSDSIFNDVASLARDTGGGFQPIAENIQAIAFAYAVDSDGDGALDFDDNGTPANTADDRIYWSVQNGGNWFELDANGDNQITAADDTDSNGSINSVDTGIAVNLDDIRAVKIWVLGRTSRIDNNYTASQSYVVGDQVLTHSDNFRRRLLSTVVTCRNMGL